MVLGSPPSRRSGLKSCYLTSVILIILVSALAAEWIEIATFLGAITRTFLVSALAAEWIEIPWQPCLPCLSCCLRPRGGVD